MRLTTSPLAVDRSFMAQSTWAIWASCVAILAGLSIIFLVDQSSGTGPVQHLYYLPIIFAAVTFRHVGGVATSLAAIVLYHLATPRLVASGYEHWDVLQVGLFLAVGVTTAKLTDDRRRLRLLASTDDLTGLHNLRSFETKLTAMAQACREAGVSLSLLVIDVDNLKSINDAHGHLAGADAVRTVGHIIAAQVPAGAVACRYGGDEFVVAVPSHTAAQANAVAQGLRAAVQATAPTLAAIRFPAGTLSISVGVASRSIDKANPRGGDQAGDALFRLADAALYRAKGRGRNHVCVATD